MTSPQATKFLTLFDITKTGPLSDAELNNIREAAWHFLLRDGDKGNLAHLVFRLSDDLIETRRRLVA